MPMRTIGQFCATEPKISPGVGRRACCMRWANSSVSSMWRRSRKMSGTMRQPMRNGIRQPQSDIASGGTMLLSSTPRSATKMTAICWLPDCQLT
jgi:hypothetical protein